ncbi:MAG: hypothetical protein JST14_09590, partial [Bacteroidetes bacterium]|nr:hypothetical protein [Bacteroidota bacterium]
MEPASDGRAGKTGNSLANYGYVYETNTNRLDKVNNNGTLLTDYTYNTIGQMVQQVDGGTTMNVSYTAYGLVKEVRDASNNLMLSYTYDDRGNRIIKTIYSSGSATKSTYYVHDAEGNVLATYDQTLPGGTPQLIEVPIYGSGRIALYKPVVNTYFYELNDHLGNVKAVIGQPQTVVYTATMETETAATEDAQFKNIAPRTVYVAANNTPGGNEAVRINNGQPNGGFSGRIGGPGISLKVMPGDVISAEVYGYYEGGSGYSSTLPASTLIAAASGIFGGVNGAPGDPGKIFSAFNQAYGGGFAGGAGSTNDLVPAAYLNMIMFDANMGVDPANLPMAAVSITSAANGSRQKISIGPITIPSPGYVYIYLDDNSNSPNWVYFDDLKVTHVQSPFVAGGDFYPFGLTMDDRQMTRESYRYGYQGQYAEKDATTGWNEFEVRDWDSKIGRWLTPDPNMQHWSPYLGMSNDPIQNVDQDGGLDDVYAFTDKSKATSIVKTNKNYDRLFIDGEYFGRQNKGWGLSVFSDARVFSGYNFGFYSYTYGESLRIGNVLASLYKSAPSRTAQSELIKASIANRDPKILYGTLAIPAAAITGGEVLSMAPAISTAYSSLVTEIDAASSYLYTSSEVLSTQAYRTILKSSFRPLVRIATPGSL